MISSECLSDNRQMTLKIMNDYGCMFFLVILVFVLVDLYFLFSFLTILILISVCFNVFCPISISIFMMIFLFFSI